jgi:hypothetical protein
MRRALPNRKQLGNPPPTGHDRVGIAGVFWMIRRFTSVQIVPAIADTGSTNRLVQAATATLVGITAQVKLRSRATAGKAPISLKSARRIQNLSL